MPNLQDTMEKTQAITTSEEIWDKVKREDLESFNDFYLNIAVKIEKILENQELEEQTRELLIDMKKIISSMGNIPKSFDPDSDVEAYRQQIIAVQNKAQRVLEN